MGSFIGIDLGTTFSVVAKIDEHGKPVIVSDRDGETLTPSCVAVNGDNVEVGRSARGEWGSGISENVVARFKRKIGTSKIHTLDGKKYTPADLSTEVLKYLISSREDIEEIDEVVVTVPANFANEAREATMEAARRAGLTVNYIINEPTAAALCYSFREGMNLEGIYAIYDMGGGTFDISIIRIQDKDVEVLTSNGVHKLGGIDFDDMLKKMVEEKYQSVAGEAVEIGDYDIQRAEDDKKELSRRETIKTRVNRKTIQITRQEFEELISAKITQAEMLCESTLDESGLKPEDIKGVLCAGGSTRIPMVQASIKRVFAQEPIFKANVDEVVALGAALYAAYKGDQEKLSPAQKNAISGIKFTERTGQCYGTFSLSNVDGEKRRMNSILIKKNVVIPCEASELFETLHEGQTAVRCELTESVNEETDPKFVHVVESVKLPLPPGRPAGQEIKVTFWYDVNQTMRCFFKDVETGEEVEILYNAGSKEAEVKPKSKPKSKSKPDADRDQDIDDFTVE